MKLRFAVAVMLFASLVVCGSTNIAKAQWPALGSGYAVTTDWHGVDAPMGQSVTAWAGTNDTLIKTVEFRWLDPSGNPVFTPARISVFGPYVTPEVPVGVPKEIAEWAQKYPGVTVWYASNTQSLDVLGDWGVQAIFHDSNVALTILGKNSDIIRIRATSINVVPEVPFGTVTVLLTMLGAAGVFAVRRKHSPAEAQV